VRHKTCYARITVTHQVCDILLGRNLRNRNATARRMTAVTQQAKVYTVDLSSNRHPRTRCHMDLKAFIQRFQQDGYDIVLMGGSNRESQYLSARNFHWWPHKRLRTPVCRPSYRLTFRAPGVQRGFCWEFDTKKLYNSPSASRHVRSNVEATIFTTIMISANFCHAPACGVVESRLASSLPEDLSYRDH
jgi:hypothetical protein